MLLSRLEWEKVTFVLFAAGGHSQAGAQMRSNGPDAWIDRLTISRVF